MVNTNEFYKNLKKFVEDEYDTYSYYFDYISSMRNILQNKINFTKTNQKLIINHLKFEDNGIYLISNFENKHLTNSFLTQIIENIPHNAKITFDSRHKSIFGNPDGNNIHLENGTALYFIHLPKIPTPIKLSIGFQNLDEQGIDINYAILNYVAIDPDNSGQQNNIFQTEKEMNLNRLIFDENNRQEFEDRIKRFYEFHYFNQYLETGSQKYYEALHQLTNIPKSVFEQKMTNAYAYQQDTLNEIFLI